MARYNKIEDLIEHLNVDRDILISNIRKYKTFKNICNNMNLNAGRLKRLLTYYDLNINDYVSIEEQKKSHADNIKKSNLKIYGYEHHSLNEKVKEKISESHLKKYDHISKELILEYINKYKFLRKTAKKLKIGNKALKSFMNKYNIIYEDIVAEDELKALHKKNIVSANIKKYGVENPAQLESYHEKRKANSLLKYGVDSPSKLESTKEKILNTMKKNGTNRRSNQEREVYEFIKSFYKGEVIINTRKEIGTEMDIYIPEFKIGIEYNGNFWHSLDSKKIKENKLYHYDKSIKARNKGIRLIHIYEWEWFDDRIRPILESVLKISLGYYEEKIYAKQCVIREIDNKTYKDFCELNHLQGYRHADIKLGLFYKDRLVQLMSFGKPIHSKNKYQYEIVRGCPGSNNIVVGGVSKLYKYFIKNYNPESIMSFGDFNKFDGSSYEMLGMTLDRMDKGNRWFVNRKTGKISNWLYRNKEKRDKLIEESFVIYGAGNLVYKWQNPNLE